MDRFRGRTGRRGNDEEVPRIVVQSPPEDVPFADSPGPSAAPIATPEEVVVEELSKPECADPAGENAKLMDDDEDAPQARRASLRRNSISLPNLDNLELQELREQHRRRTKNVSSISTWPTFAHAAFISYTIGFVANTGSVFQMSVAGLPCDVNQIIC